MNVSFAVCPSGKWRVRVVWTTMHAPDGDSVMPEWERFLSNDEMWDVILFLYADTGYRPRTFEEGAEAQH